ncbi:MAG: serine/threonine-protein phosphatase [Phreatobacter sp.]|uniref:PP2C family protein-serine/threonine phosphatase n=1 Tax=Phreatobacter sp. TaxID=1966341 RepID=UPI00273590FF|nr:PP2C family serine/threonine-protein phosphatase [Phreatobacter sp.]MDP2801274.1 serine/threonine-protein phosphatase [Phreatobacter sp.]
MTLASPKPNLLASGQSRCGSQHATNEDAFLSMPEAGLFAVADGMGGHSDGGLASRSIIEMLQMVIQEAKSLRDGTSLVEDGLRSVATALWREGQGRPVPVIVGSTVAAIYVADGYAVCLWVGDSRIYLSRQGELFMLSRDHNVANLEGTPDVVGSRGAMLTRAVGASETVEIDRVVVPLEASDTLLLCTDGLTKVVDDVAIGSMLDGNLDGLAARLVALAAVAGARDDVTVVTVRYEG